jgi:hypothetical protein
MQTSFTKTTFKIISSELFPRNCPWNGGWHPVTILLQHCNQFKNFFDKGEITGSTGRASNWNSFIHGHQYVRNESEKSVCLFFTHTFKFFFCSLKWIISQDSGGSNSLCMENRRGWSLDLQWGSNMLKTFRMEISRNWLDCVNVLSWCCSVQAKEQYLQASTYTAMPAIPGLRAKLVTPIHPIFPPPILKLTLHSCIAKQSTHCH